MEFSDWLQSTAGNVIDLWAQNEYVNQPKVEAAKWQALGEAGYYREGQAGTTAQASNGIAINGTTVLLIGGVLLAVLMLKD